MGWVGLGEFVIVMTQTQPNPLLIFFFFFNWTQPHQPLKTDPTRWVGLGRVGFDELVGWLYTPIQNHQSYCAIVELKSSTIVFEFVKVGLRIWSWSQMRFLKEIHLRKV